jgi:cbb3-type cytochrome c oxidase subunit III
VNVSRRLKWVTLLLLLGAVAAAYGVWQVSRQRRVAMQLDPDRISATPALADRVLQWGHPVFLKHCANCHGAEGHGSHLRGVPDLTDRDYLYGAGLASEIEAIVLHGIRSGDSRGWRLASMPAYGHERPYAAEPIPSLSPGEIRDVVQYLLKAASARGSRGRAAGKHDFPWQGGLLRLSYASRDR